MRALVVALLVALPAFSGFGADDTHRQAALALLEAMRMEDQVAEAREQMLDMQMRANPAMIPFRDLVDEFMRENMGWGSLRDTVATHLAQELTEAELKEIAAFYRTPTGQKAITALPALMKKSAEIGVKRIQENSAELQRRIAARAAELDQEETGGY